MSLTASRTVARGVAFAAVLMLMTTIVAIAPANAGATDCPIGSGYVCLYKNSSFATGGKAEYSGNDSNYSNNTFDWCYLNCGLNDAISSIRNRGNSYDTRHYVDSGYTGSFLTVARGYSWDLYGLSWNDELSSHKWI